MRQETKRKLISVITDVILFTIGVLILLSSYNYMSVGNRKEISLQSPLSSITASDLYAAQNGLLDQENNTNSVEYLDSVISYTDIHPRYKADVLSLSNNTFQVVAVSNEDGIQDELVDLEEFIIDGTPFWVAVDIANMRETPSTSSEIIDFLMYGERVIRISYGDQWSLIRNADGEEGYMLTSLLTEKEIATPTPTPTSTPTPTATMTPTATPIPTATPTPVEITSTPTPEVVEISEATETTESAPDYVVTELYGEYYAACELNVRTGPGISYALVKVLNTGDAIDVVGVTDNGWYKTALGNFVKADLCTDVVATPTPTPIVELPSVSEEDTSSGYSDFATYCLQFVGTPYVYAGMSPSGFDCSGFVSYCMANYYGISLPHNAAEISYLGTAVSGENIQCGDVLCHDYNGDGYIDHVSLYIGNGTCIHASNSREGVITSPYPMGSVVTIRRFI